MRKPVAKERLFLFSLILWLISTQSPGYGQPLFSRTYGHFDFNYGRDIIVDPNGYYILGNTSESNSNSTAMLIKTDTAGKILKYNYQTSKSIISANKLFKKADKLYLCGTTNNTETNDYDCFLSIYDTSLTLLKTVTYGGPSWDFANRIAGSETFIFVAGQTYSTPNGFSQGTISKFSLNGDSLDTYYYGSEGEAAINSLIIRGDTELIYTGWYQAPDSLYPSAFAVSSNSNGISNWEKNLSGYLGKSAGIDLTNGPQERIYICGSTEINLGTTKKDAYLAILGPRGEILSCYIHQHSNDDEITSIVVNETAQVYTAGFTKSYGGGGKDFWLLEFDGNGYFVTGNTFGGAFDETPESIKYVHADSGAVVCGTSMNSGFSNASILVLKLNKAFQVNNSLTHEVKVEETDNRSSFHCYPNPATDRISFGWSGVEKIEHVEIFDMMGQRFLHYDSGANTDHSIDISSIPAQILFIKATTAKGMYTCKLIKQ